MRHRWAAFLNEADVGTRATHINRDDIRIAGQPSHVTGANSPGRRSGEGHVYGPLRRGLWSKPPTVRGHYEQRSLEPTRAQATFQFADIATDHGLHIGIQHRRHGPFVLAEYR